MLDISVSYNRYKFIGHEFLTWLWFIIENHAHVLKKADPDFVSLEIGNRIVFENRSHERLETLTIKGDDPGFEEGMMALRKGALVTELNLSYKAGDQKWAFTLKGESFHLSNLKVPESGLIETGDDLEGMFIDKAFLYEKIFTVIDKVFNFFIKTRISVDWAQKVVPDIKKWIFS